MQGALKKRFDPVLAKTGHGWLDAILHEVKGANLRKGFRAVSGLVLAAVAMVAVIVAVAVAIARP